MPRRSQDRPRKRSGSSLPAPQKPPNFDTYTPKFCLRHLHRDHNVACLDVDKQADFAMALQHRANMTWRDIKLADRHGMGSELIPADQIRPSIPGPFQDHERFTVLRYSGNLPMVGVRAQDVFHIIWIERDYGDVYSHR